MNIRSANNNFIQNNIRLNNFSKTNTLSKMGVDIISFTSRSEEAKAAMQARIYMTHSIDEHKEAYEISQDAFRVYQTSKELMAEVNKLKESSKSIFEEGMQSPFDAVGEEALIVDEKGRVLQEVYDTEDNQVVFAKYDTKHNILYQAFLSDKNLIVFKRNEESGELDSYAFDRETGELFQHATGVEFKPEGYDADSEIYIQGKTVTYSFDVDIKVDKRDKADEKYTFEDGEVVEYATDTVERDDDEYFASNVLYLFANHRLDNAMLQYENMEGQYRNAQRVYIYGIDGCVEQAERDVSWDDMLENKTSKEIFEFGDNGLKQARVNVFENLKTSKMTSKKLFEYSNDRAVSCKINYQTEPDKSPKYDKEISVYF